MGSPLPFYHVYIVPDDLVHTVTLVRHHRCSVFHLETQSPRKFIDPLALTFFLTSLPKCSFSLRFRSCFADVSVETGLLTTLHFDSWWFSAVASVK